MTDSTPRELVRLVLDRITALGDQKAAEYFEVSRGTIISWRKLKSFPSIVAAQRVWDSTVQCMSPELWNGADNVPIQVGLPIYRYQEPMNHVTLFINYKQYGPDKVNLIPRLRTLIDEARNDLAATFLASKSEWLIMVDGDMWLPVGNAALLRKHGWLRLPDALGNVSAFKQIMSHSKEYRIVGAMYRDRKSGVRAQCEKGFSSPTDNARLLAIMAGTTPPGGLEQMGWVGTGMIRIHRSVFEEMIEAAKPGGPLADIAPPPPPRDKEPYGFFGRRSEWRGEDIAVCRRAGKLGIKVWLDTNLVAGHEGSTVF